MILIYHYDTAVGGVVVLQPTGMHVDMYELRTRYAMCEFMTEWISILIGGFEHFYS